MTTPRSALAFRNLRTWKGSQDRAFEELAYQLLKNAAPDGSRAIRTGNPDGGVEWYATLSDGSEWGWQAKFITDSDSLMSAMTRSVRRVALERPNCTKLTFVIPTNLSTGTRGGRSQSGRQRFESRQVAWRQDIDGAARIKIDLVQESDLLSRLALPAHRGRVWFWWGDVTMSTEWLQQRHAEQAAAAGMKYRPDLQVDVPIQTDLVALGFDETATAELRQQIRGVVNAARSVHLRFDAQHPLGKMYQAIVDGAEAIVAVANGMDFDLNDAGPHVANFVERCLKCRDAIQAAQFREEDIALEHRRRAEGDPDRPSLVPDQARSYDVGSLGRAIRSLDRWQDSRVGRLWRQGRPYFLTGQAGSGKTHLLLDATARALAAGRGAVFLSGARFGTGNPWSDIADQLGLEAVGADVLLGAMDAAGEAASTTGTRFLIMIDALNESSPDYWPERLRTLRAAIAPYPHVALAVSCRDTYVDLVLDDDAGSYEQREHPGFADREVEATQKYFQHYGLEAPRIPLLTPEFTLPLFLRLFCEGISESSEPVPAGHQGRIAIFDRYLEVKLRSVGRRLVPAAQTTYERRAAVARATRLMDALVNELSGAGQEGLRADRAETLVRETLEVSAEAAARTVGFLQDEGILTRERLYLGDGTHTEGVRIVFQAFSDFLILRNQFGLSTDPLHDQALKRWLLNTATYGVLESATVFLPEVYEVELPDYLGITLPRQKKRLSALLNVDPDGYQTRQLLRSLFRTLPYRKAEAVTERSIQLLDAAQLCVSREQFYAVLVMLAPQLGNRLNAFGLHDYLARFSMPRRDCDLVLPLTTRLRRSRVR